MTTTLADVEDARRDWAHASAETREAKGDPARESAAQRKEAAAERSLIALMKAYDAERGAAC